MPLTDATLNLLGTYLTTLCTHITLHSADPGTTGTNLITAAARVAAAWSVDADGDLTLSGAAAFTGATPGATVTHIGLWSAASGGTFRGGFARTSGDATVNSAGEYNVTDIAIAGTSTG
jgi:hypothetical protein